MDKRLAGVILFLPCIDGNWDKSQWGEWVWDAVRKHRYQQQPATAETLRFWPLTDEDAQGKGRAVLSGRYVYEWSLEARKLAEQGGSIFNGNVTLEGFWNDFHTRPMDYFDRISPVPLLWVMATQDVVCGPLQFTKGVYDKLDGPKDICIVEGEHLPAYFDPAFPKGLEAMLAFLKKYSS